ncbi:MAG: hypothetical protein IRZ01_04405 [Thermoflavifilum aggregans]|nr:hypothetical protein [Thermoflavifilum aggregans]
MPVNSAHHTSRIRLLLSTWLLSIFIYSSAPRILLHEIFANHDDTIDLPVGNLYHVSPQHIHCAFMHIHLAPYIPVSSPPLPVENCFFNNVTNFAPLFPILSPTPNTFLRAPPVCFALS